MSSIIEDKLRARLADPKGLERTTMAKLTNDQKIELLRRVLPTLAVAHNQGDALENMFVVLCATPELGGIEVVYGANIPQEGVLAVLQAAVDAVKQKITTGVAPMIEFETDTKGNILPSKEVKH